MSNRLPNDEWLHLAKATGVGQQRRTRHRSERTEALTVGNTPDRWWAFCQRCKKGAVEMKTHVFTQQAAPRESKLLTRPTDARNIEALRAFERDELTRQLAEKGMDWMYLPGGILTQWSATRHRLLISTPSGTMGRDTSGKSDQKWLTYDRQHFLTPEDEFPRVVLVEDTYSYYKVRYAARHFNIPMSVMCTLGTALHASAFRLLLEKSRRVWSFYDGDPAGWKGEAQNHIRLAAVGLAGKPYTATACAPTGMDPKDMKLNAIAAHLDALIMIGEQ
ncbi:DNA primase [Variovorax phage VAC_51]|uniref:DNA primase n=1 Tax=Variovorax phage VAC_51 TaxID=2985242 RepID=A0A9N6WWZ2_9CAUD|nr:DNA primase [Variovorax phage VAC_51]